MARFLPLSIILITLAGCASSTEEQGATNAALSDGDSDLASIADAATETGDIDGVAFVPASEGGHETGRPGDIQFVVIHDIEGSGRAGVETFRAPDAKVSAHYVVDKLGVAVQMVHESDTAYHTGNHYWNGAAIGIEHSGVATEDGYTDEEYTASAKLVASIVTRYNIPVDRDHIISHSQVPSTDEDQFTPACTPDRTDCGGRNHHDDPGQYWDWDGYMAKVQAAVDALAKDTKPVPGDFVPIPGKRPSRSPP
jgi:N-acetyl-anhydromuramyl-L-alanine amidase AmpD